MATTYFQLLSANSNWVAITTTSTCMHYRVLAIISWKKSGKLVGGRATAPVLAIHEIESSSYQSLEGLFLFIPRIDCDYVFHSIKYFLFFFLNKDSYYADSRS